MLELVENRLYANAGDSTLLAAVLKLTDRPTVAAFLNRDSTLLAAVLKPTDRPAVAAYLSRDLAMI